MVNKEAVIYVEDSSYNISVTHIEGKKERTRKRRKKSSEKTRAGRFRKRRGESQSFLLGDADQESETRMSKNALRTGRRQAVEICQSEDYNEVSVKSLLEGILAEKREARELKEKRETREYELERLRLSNATETVSVSSADLEGQGVNRRVNLKYLVPKFNAKNADINLFFEIFVRQAKKEKVAEDRWVSQLIPLLPIEIARIVAKEPLEKSDDYPHIKNLLLARFQFTPIALRDRFESHQRRPGAMWADLVFELRSYLDNWLAGMKVGDFAA
ncbi:uncharacterized protein TNCV_3062091 [Trichonephila clavipes]|nr:uncharacterized protein TNCV_3062091 [Trichonephila clavipes]